MNTLLILSTLLVCTYAQFNWGYYPPPFWYGDDDFFDDDRFGFDDDFFDDDFFDDDWGGAYTYGYRGFPRFGGYGIGYGGGYGIYGFPNTYYRPFNQVYSQYGYRPFLNLGYQQYGLGYNGLGYKPYGWH